VLPILPPDVNGDTRPLWLAVGLLTLVALGIIVYAGPKHLSRRTVRQTGEKSR